MEREAQTRKVSIKIKIGKRKEVEHHLTIKEKDHIQMIDEEVHEKTMIQFQNLQSFL